MGAMHGQSSGFLSVSMPNTFSMGWNYVKKYIKEKNLECPDRDVFEVLEKRVKRYLKKGYLVGSGKVIEGDVRDLDTKVEHDSVQLLFTSPPYLKVIKYGLYNWIRLWFLTESGSHEEVDAKLDDTHALNEYLEFMKDTLTATLPLLDRKRGLSCWAIGDVKGLNLAWAVWHHAGSKIEVKADDGTVLKYKLIAIVEDKIPDNQKVSKIWKTLAHHVEYVNETEEVVESLGQWETEKEAKAALKKAEEKEGLTLKIRVEKTNDKSGKATPTDRILIIAPESSKPKAFMKAQDLDWKPFHTTNNLTLLDFNMQTKLPGAPLSLEFIRERAPHFSNVLSRLHELEIESPDPVDLPECLGLKSRAEFSSQNHWSEYLSSEHQHGLSVREIYLRVLLVYAVSDQGADIPGVRLFMDNFISKCYEAKRNLFHERQLIGDHLIIDAAYNGAEVAFNERSEKWSKQGKRSASTYSVFTVDSVRGKPSANWYVNSRIAPPLSLPHLVNGGLTTLLSNCKKRDDVKENIRQNTKHGLFYSIGDKALDLFGKWIFGTFNLFDEKDGISKTDIAIPMDQRIGKVLMRCGFMDELYNLDNCVESGKFLFDDQNRNNSAKLVNDRAPLSRTFLRVTEFRKHGRIGDKEISEVLNHYRSKEFRGKILPPQIAINSILELFRRTSDVSILPHQLDDLLMNIASFCHDRNPDCNLCPIQNQCQANVDKGMSFLKNYYT